jgi:hypothetical protein
VEVAEVTSEAVRRYLDGRGPITRFWLLKYHTLTGFFPFMVSRVRRSSALGRDFQPKIISAPAA